MNRFVIYCTKEQAKKALKLGAPIEFEGTIRYRWNAGCREPYRDIVVDQNGEPIVISPTAEQMVGWLDEKGQEIEIGRIPKDGDFAVFINGIQECGCYYPTRRNAMLGAIDFALILLENGD